jgi:hypothetical protein
MTRRESLIERTALCLLLTAPELDPPSPTAALLRLHVEHTSPVTSRQAAPLVPSFLPEEEGIIPSNGRASSRR